VLPPIDMLRGDSCNESKRLIIEQAKLSVNGSLNPLPKAACLTACPFVAMPASSKCSVLYRYVSCSNKQSQGLKYYVSNEINLQFSTAVSLLKKTKKVHSHTNTSQ
jgi:hypothetical protein